MKSLLCKEILYLITIYAAFFTSPLFASLKPEPNITKSKISSLLDHPTITAIYKDRQGLVWLGTQYGLYRINGHDTRFFSANSSAKNWIPASDIRAITENRHGDLLIATFGAGVLRFDSYSNSFKKYRF